ncbi:MAG: ABC transporter substrate-binding protein, partial [Microbacteriaceae bacterium]
MKKSLGAIAALILTGGLLAGCASGDTNPTTTTTTPSEPVTIRVVTSVSNSFPFIAVQAMEKLGTFEGTNLKIEVIEGTTPTIGQILAGNQADIALAGAGTVVAVRSQGLEVSLVGSDLSYWDQRIIVGADSGINTVEQLKGKNFGISGAGSPGHYSVLKLAQKMGWVEGTDYTLTTLGNLGALTAALTAGSIDMFAWSSQAAFQMEGRGDGKILALGSDYVGPNVLQAFGVMDTFMAKHPEAVKEFFEAYYAMVKKLQADPKLFTDVLVNDWEVAQPVADRVAKESLPDLSSD